MEGTARRAGDRVRVFWGATAGFCAGAGLGMPIGALVCHVVGGRYVTTAALLAFLLVTAVIGLAAGIGGALAAARTQRPRRAVPVAILSIGLLLAYPLSTGPAVYAKNRRWITWDEWRTLWSPINDACEGHIPEFVVRHDRLAKQLGVRPYLFQEYNRRWELWWHEMAKRHDGYVLREVDGISKWVKPDGDHP